MYSRDLKSENARYCFFADGEHAEFLFDFIVSRLSGDYFYALEDIKRSLQINTRYLDHEYVFAVVSDQKIYCLVSGGASLYLVRGGQKTALIKTLANTSSIVSGVIAGGDFFEVETSTGKESFSSDGQEGSQEWSQNTQGNAMEYGDKTGVRARIVAFIDSLLAKLPERRIVVHGDDLGRQRAKKASLLGFLLLILLGVSIYFGMKQRDIKIARDEYEPQLLAAIHDFEESLELSPLSSARARELILSSRSAANELTGKGVEDPRLARLQEDISKHIGKIAGIYDNPAEMYLDLSIVSSGFEADDIAFSGGLVRVLDTKNRRLVGIETSNKRTRVISGPDYLADAISVAAYSDRSFILSSDGIREVTSEVSLVIKPEEWEPKNVLFAAFAGNIYVLDKLNNQIWRYSGVRGGFLSKEAWLGEGFTKDTSSASFFAIDGVIWTLDESGNFKNYSLGAPSTFGVVNETSPIAKVSGFYTDDQSSYVYILDSGNKRIAVLRKNGEYVSEYVAPELSDANDLVVDEENKMLLFLAKGKLYMIKALHLDEDNENN